MSYLELRDITKTTSLSRSTIYRMIGRGEFPKQRKISPRRVAWLKEDIDEWMKKRVMQ
ncbi:helix-turn-helix transcriptional regulator [Escherichia coli]|uniref:helix-turn-helix transcriptional regulator n=1 Tax=Escherichia coli TaxID=562 RepID=UPI001D48FBAE|nr:AlpA family phage regulatory protein [Escherichia coli O166:H6]EFN6737879.1 AlpA family phage regulatory protein [Escherichia coli H6]